MRVYLDDGAFMPERAHPTDGGADLKSPVDAIVPAHGSVFIDTGVHVELLPDTTGELVSKSGLNKNYGITSTGLIDEPYTGSIGVKLYNHSGTDYLVRRGDKITQLVIRPVYYVQFEKSAEPFAPTDRGDNGFGSTGK